MRHRLSSSSLGKKVSPVLVTAFIGCVLAACGGVAAVRPVASVTRLVQPHFTTSPIIVNGLFAKPFELEGGVLTIMPVGKNYKPVRPIGYVASQAWSTSQVAGERAGLIGLGIVTISKSYQGASSVKHLVAWVALMDTTQQVAYCPVMPHPLTHYPKLPSPNQSAVVIGDALGSPAVVFNSSRVGCGVLQPARAVNATEVVSVPWTFRAGSVAVDVPACASFWSDGFGSTRTSTSFYYEVIEHEAQASVESLVVPRGCKPRHTVVLDGDPQARGVTAATRHSFRSGLQLQVSPCALPWTWSTDGPRVAAGAACRWHPSTR